MKKLTKRIALLLTLSLLVQLLPTVLPVFAATTKELTDQSFNGEGLWITEIYHNDIDRSEAANTREEDGYLSIDLFASASDLMEYVEVCSTHDDPIMVNDLYELYVNNTKMTITDMSGNANVTLSKGQVAVLWNYRTDIVMPTEAQFRSALRIPDDAVVLKFCYGSNIPADTCTVSIKSKATGQDISSFTPVRDTHTKDGFTVDLKMPVFKSSAMEVYRVMNLPSAGIVYTAQLNGLIQAKTPADFDGKGLYITELHPNDINRDSTFGTGTNDVMEFFEITNTTDKDINLNNEYRICFTIREGFRKPLNITKYSSSASDHVGSGTSCIVPAGKSVVLWCYRYSKLSGYSSFPSGSKFRETYSIPSDVSIFIFTNQNGMSNENRALEIYKKDTNELVSSYTYIGADECADGKSAHLTINPEGPAMILSGANAATTAGTTKAAQLSFIVDDGSAITMTLQPDWAPPTYLYQGQDLRVYFDYKNTGNLTRLSSSTYYRLDGKGDWILSAEGGIRVTNRFETVIPAAELFDHNYVEFYVCSSNEYRTTYKGIYKVNIKKLNEVDGIRTNISEGENVKGTISITANDGTTNAKTQIYIDGVKQTTSRMLEDGGYFTYTLDGIDSYFRSAITTTSDERIHHIGKWAYENTVKQAKHIDSSYFTTSGDNFKVTLRIWSGTIGATAADKAYPDANRDDFTITNLKFKLANGKEYLPSKIGPSSYNGVDTSGKTNTSTAFDAVHNIGDSSGWCPYMNVTFTIPMADSTAVGIKLNTTSLSNGKHTLKVTNGTSTKEVTFIVDNNAPVINLGIADGSTLTKLINIDPQVTDANHIDQIVTYLDGEIIQTPYQTTAFQLGEGNHTLEVRAMDAAGNSATAKSTFTIDDISMTLTDAGVRDITHSNAQLYLTAQSNSATSATFYRAERIDTANIQTSTVDGLLPHIQYTLDVGTASAGDNIVVNWNGSASGTDDTHVTTMFVLNTATGAWDTIAAVDASGSITNASFPAENHVKDGKATIIVQCTADSALPDLDTATDGVTGNNANWDGMSRPDQYDFSFAWITDTQIYVQRYQNQIIQMNNWIVDNMDEWKIKYLMHTGDIIDDWDAMYQWENADVAMKIFDDAGLPYGVLPGNHDVASGLDQRHNYYTYFNEDRFNVQPTYGESYQNNFGHYDLVSENGQDFIIVYMGWVMNKAEMDWMNKVLAEHSDRKAILCFHGYTHIKESVDGLLDYFGVMIRDNVVAKNPNVFAVLNGHYSGSTYQTVRFDDNKDGKLDRTVYQICTDYQSVEKGGLQYVKFLYFDLDNDKVYVNSYSPKMDDFNYFDTAAPADLKALAKAQSNGVVSDLDVESLILSVNFDTTGETILENSFSAYLYTDEVLGTANMNAATGRIEADVSGLTPETDYMWYAVLENENTGILQTDLYEFTTGEAPVLPNIVLKTPTLLLEDTIKLNIYYTIDQEIPLDKMGMITWNAQPTVVDISTADNVYPGATFNESNGQYGVNTDGIPAQNLGDIIYFCIYAEMDDGTIVYSKQVQYSPTTYAYNQLKTGTSDEMKALLVAILSYGAAAQIYLNDTDPLVNNQLTEEAKALVEAYNPDMVHSVSVPSASKQGAMADNGGFSAKKPTIALDGAFSINYYFTPRNSVAGDMTFYYWNATDFAKAEVLSIENTTGSAVMTNENGVYSAAISGIAAKDIDGPLYACGVYTDANGNTYSTGVLPYSLGFYCGNQVNTGSAEIKPLAAAIAVYGYYAAAYFRI